MDLFLEADWKVPWGIYEQTEIIWLNAFWGSELNENSRVPITVYEDGNIGVGTMYTAPDLQAKAKQLLRAAGLGEYLQ